MRGPQSPVPARPLPWSRILLHAPAIPVVDSAAVGAFLTETFAVPTVERPEFFASSSRKWSDAKTERASAALASARVGDPAKPLTPTHEEPHTGVVAVEKRWLDEGHPGRGGVLYDGLRLMRLASGWLRKEEREAINIIITPRLPGTWDESDLRYHIRAVVCGFPSFISTSGLVEGPAKPREFYLMRIGPWGNLMPPEGLREKFRGRILDYGDDRLTEVLKGYAAMAVLWHFGEEPFCPSKECRLFNAHWQEELLHAQVGSGRFCRRHERVVEGIRRSAAATTVQGAAPEPARSASRSL